MHRVSTEILHKLYNIFIIPSSISNTAHKIQRFATKFFYFFLLTVFVFGKFTSFTHNLSHQNQVSFESLSINAASDNSDPFKTSHLQNKNLEKPSKNSNNTNFHDCLLCSFFNSQNHNIPLPNPILFLASFFLVFFLRAFDREKLSFLLSSNSSRAPPPLLF